MPTSITGWPTPRSAWRAWIWRPMAPRSARRALIRRPACLALVLAGLICLAHLPFARAAISDRPRTPACAWYDPALRGEELAVARRIWRQNVLRRYAVVHPSPAYGGVWLRDSFWTLTA